MKILNYYTSAVLWESPCSTMRATVEKAIAAGANLDGANLGGANLGGANLGGANLDGADLRSADLRSANLRSADLRSADLRSADLRSADLRSANLRSANLGGADLGGANLRSADLRSANLGGAQGLTPLVLAQFSIIPDTGDFIAWKQCRNHIIVKLRIPAKASRSNAHGRKCRAEFVEVIQVIGAEVGISNYDTKVTYEKGKTVKCHQWNKDRWTECGGGIHFFITRIEAEKYSL